MDEIGVSPLVYAVPALALVLFGGYFAYGVVDRAGLERIQTEARVTGKELARGSTTYHTNMIAGRVLTQSAQNPDMYIVKIDLGGELAAGLIAPALYESLQTGETVRIAYQRTRITRQIVVTDVSR